MRPGDVFVLNAPYNGGTHLPDVTVIAPVYLARRRAVRRARVLRRRARPSRRHRRHHAGLDAARFDARRRGGRAARQRAAGRRRTSARSRDARAARQRPLPVAQRRAESRGLAGAGRGLREGRGGAREDGRALFAAGRARVHEARAGQRRGGGAPRARRADGRPFRVRDGQRREDRRHHRDRPGEARSDDRFHRHQRAAARPISTRRPRSARRPCCTCSERWSTTRFR